MLAGCSMSVMFHERTKLGLLSVSNWDRTAGHAFELRVSCDGTRVHESTHTVEKFNEASHMVPGAVVDCTWEDVAGEYVVAARIDNDEWQEFNLQDAIEDSPECVLANVEYGTYWTIDETDPLNIRVRPGCDHVDQADGRCPASISNAVPQPVGEETN